MTADHIHKEEIRTSFQQRWPLPILEKMTLPEYNSIKQVSGGDTYCHWIEHHTDKLGRIKGYDSYKFGIYNRAAHTTYKPEGNTLADGDYNFKSRYGSTKEDAFQNVKNLLLKVVQYAQNGQYAEIDSIDLDNRLKWKTAFIYADLNTLLPIYNEKKLQSIVARLGLKNLVYTSSFAAMNRYLASQRPSEMSVYEYAHWLYHRLDEYLGIKQSLRHFILGSKYGEHDDLDMLPGMKAAGVISTDYGPVGISLAEYYGEDDSSTLQQYLEENGCAELATATQQLHQFLNIRPGDLVAVKKRSYPKDGHGVLEIDTLAVVVALNGETYSYDPVLGHCLSVQFIPYQGPRELHIDEYNGVVQHVVDEENIKAIFGQCAVKNVEDLAKVLNGTMRRAIESLNTTTSTRRAIAECTITREHNKLQERFADFLREKYGSEKVKLEQNYVDIRLIEENRVTFYEVKKDYRPIRCIREALGQLLEYAYRNQEGNEVRCVVVGPVLANEEDEAYVSFLRSHLQLDFTYIGFP